MSKLHKFEEFLNESRGSKVEKAEGHLEDLTKEEFIHKIFGKTEFGWTSDYELDNDTERSSTGTERIVWIEIKDAPKEQLDLIDKDYEAFVAPFKAWAEKLGYYDPEITTPSPNEKNSIIFKITI